MRVANWNANSVFKQVEEAAIDEANLLMDEVAANAAARCPVGKMTKAGKWKTATVSFIPLRRKEERLQKAKEDELPLRLINGRVVIQVN